MKVTVPKILFCLLLGLAGMPLNAISQDLTGIWRGWFITEDGEQYKCEIQIAQKKAKSISGVSYSYLDTRFYGKASLTGMYNEGGKSVLIQEIKTVELKMDAGSVACIMKYLMNYSKSGKEEFLEGTYTSKYEKAYAGFQKGDPAGGGTVFLRKVPTSDFYTEPFLRNKKDTVRTKPPVAVTKPQTKPQTNLQTKPNNSTTKKPVTKPPANNNQTTNRTRTINDTAKRTTTTVLVEKPREIPKLVIPETTRSRENELIKTLTVNSEEISVRLYDNGEVDGDTISVYLDGKPIVSSKGLSTVPITLKLKMDESNPEHILVMVAENMGRIPPNTSLMIVQDGDNRYQVSITSTEQKNAMVRFRYQKK